MHTRKFIFKTSFPLCLLILCFVQYLTDNCMLNLGNEHGRAFRDREAEEKILELTRKVGIGAQFGGKYFCHDVRVIRLPRHGASCPVGIGVSCSADRQVFYIKTTVFVDFLKLLLLFS